MDLQAVSAGLAATSVSNGIAVGVIKALDNLQAAQVAELFGSIGLGANVNALA
jgi:hypothetical protein